MKKYIGVSLVIIASLALVSTLYLQYNKMGVLNAAERSFEIIDLHAGILKKANFVPDADWANTKQSGGTGLAEAIVLKGGSLGSSQLLLQEMKGFGTGQLITYQGDDGQYYSTVIVSVQGTSVVLNPSLEATIAHPQKIRNFYADPDHPNEYGYAAIVDYALRNVPDLNKGKHVLLGDSWFDHMPRYLSDRLANQLPQATVINAGRGGDTAQNLLDRFDLAVASQDPDIVWIMAGTNDYNQYVTKEAYSHNIQALIRKINDLGARAIVFNSSVGKPITHAPDGTQYPVPLDTKKQLSHDYYNVLN